METSKGLTSCHYESDLILSMLENKSDNYVLKKIVMYKN